MIMMQHGGVGCCVDVGGGRSRTNALEKDLNDSAASASSSQDRRTCKLQRTAKSMSCVDNKSPAMQCNVIHRVKYKIKACKESILTLSILSAAVI